MVFSAAVMNASVVRLRSHLLVHWARCWSWTLATREPGSTRSENSCPSHSPGGRAAIYMHQGVVLLVHHQLSDRQFELLPGDAGELAGHHQVERRVSDALLNQHRIKVVGNPTPAGQRGPPLV